MATTSIKQTIELIESVLTNQFSNQIVMVNFEKFANTTKAKKYPMVSFYFSDSGAEIQNNTNVCSLEFEFLDVISGLNEKNERRKEVISDMFQVATSFVEYLREESGVLLDYPISITTFDNKYKDGLGGVSFTLNINIARPCLVI